MIQSGAGGAVSRTCLPGRGLAPIPTPQEAAAPRARSAVDGLQVNESDSRAGIKPCLPELVICRLSRIAKLRPSEAGVSLRGRMLLSASRNQVPRRNRQMAYVIAEPCIGTKDTACVDACPVDCIHPKKDEDGFEASRSAVYRSGRVHRLRRLCSGLPGIGHLRAGRSAGEVGSLHREERDALRPLIAVGSA